MTSATAPGKVILVGEHAVVYGRPAIAVPVWNLLATATIRNRAAGSGCLLIAQDVGLQIRLVDAPEDLPLALVARLALARLHLPPDPDWQIELHSEIPIASGLGSGAALSTALVRAIAVHSQQPIAPAVVSQLVYASERLYHGTPSGIDNTVVAYGVPIWFVKGEGGTPFFPRRPFTLAIADSGVAAPTKETVGDVRRAWQADPARYEACFDAIGAIVTAARRALEKGDLAGLGQLFDRNQALLVELGVSSAFLERLIAAARQAGASGAKLSGGGRGGNIIALVQPDMAEAVAAALLTVGARRVVVTTVNAGGAAVLHK
jgi:mevalonate kinase